MGLIPIPGSDKMDNGQNISGYKHILEYLYDRYYKNMTIKEIAQERGVCGETIRIKIKYSKTRNV